ncbi:hypothetical protein LCGC14_1804750, partial [marine sediment metagenome]
IVGGNFTFNSADVAYAGGISVKTDNATINDIMEFDKGSNSNLSNYQAITMWIYVDKDWANGDRIDIYGWDGTSQVGTRIDLSNYFDWGSLDVWHKITIPLVDMTLTGETINALRIEIIAKEGKSPKFYIDNFQIEETGTTSLSSFIVKPESGTWLHVKELHYFIADNNFSTILADATVPLIPYNSFLGLPALSTGLLYQRIIDGEVILSATIKQLSDILQNPGTELVDFGSSGQGATNTWLKIKVIFTEPLILKFETNDHLKFIVSDDMSGLDIFRVSVGCKIEERK